nr:ribosomal protein L28 [Cyanidium caldarium]
MSRFCELTLKKTNNACRITYSHKRNSYLQMVNLHYKKIYSYKMQCHIKVRISTKAIKLLKKNKIEKILKTSHLSIKQKFIK